MIKRNQNKSKEDLIKIDQKQALKNYLFIFYQKME